MNQPEQDDSPNVSVPSQAQASPKRSLGRRLFWAALMVLVLLLLGVSAIAFRVYQLSGTAEGSQKILNSIQQLQSVMSFESSSGTLRDGLTLNKLQLKFNAVDVNIDKATVSLGWRLLFSKQVHLKVAQLGELKIIKHTPPTNTPFTFDPIKVPVALRLDNATIDRLVIVRPTKTDIVFTHIGVKNTSFINDVVTLHDGHIQDPHFKADKLNGTIRFAQKYPLNITGDLIIPALETQKLTPFHLQANGDLAQIQVKASMNWPDLATATGEVRIFEEGVPYTATLKWDDFTLPWATSEKLRLQTGSAKLTGNEHGLTASINSDLSGKHVPTGHYVIVGHTNWSGIDIHALTAKVLTGTVTGTGHVDWAKAVTWQLSGALQAVHIHPLVPTSAHAYLPNRLTATWQSNASLGHTQSNINAVIQQPATANNKNGGERWQVSLAKNSSIGDETKPLMVKTAWQNLHNQVAGIGTVFSPVGQANIDVFAGKTTIALDTQLVHPTTQNMQDSRLPTGRYQANVQLQGSQVQIDDIHYRGEAGQLHGTSAIHLANLNARGNVIEPLKWQANLMQVNVDPRYFVAGLPFKSVVGQLQASGVVTASQQQMLFKNIALQAYLANKEQFARTQQQAVKPILPKGKTIATNEVALSTPINTNPAPINTTNRIDIKGNANVALLFKQQAKQSIFAGYAVQFTGDLSAPKIPSGFLTLNLSGTPELLRIDKLEHQGVAGQITGKGSVFLGNLTTKPLRWDAQLSMQHFNPYVVSNKFTGDLTGTLDTQGEWGNTRQLVSMRNTDIQGTLNKLPLKVQGQLNIDLQGAKKQDVLQALQAQALQTQGLQLVWGKNSAVITPLATTENTSTTFSTTTSPEIGLLAHLNLVNLAQLYPQAAGQLMGTIQLKRMTAPATLTSTLSNTLLGSKPKQILQLGFDLSAKKIMLIMPKDKTVNNQTKSAIVPTSESLLHTETALMPSDQSIPPALDTVETKQVFIEAAYLKGSAALDKQHDSHIQLSFGQVLYSDKVISQGNVQFDGSLAKHQAMLNVGQNKRSVAIDLEGGFSPIWDWQGAITKGNINVNGHAFNLEQPATITWQNTPQILNVAMHCWQGMSHVCLTSPLQASKDNGLVAMTIQDLDVHDLQDLMPVGMYWLGKMNGMANFAWQANSQPILNAEIHTDNGSIGLTADDPQDPPFIIPYNRLSLVVKTQPEGMKVRFDMKTPAVGTGYVDAIIDPKSTPKTINGALVLDKIEASVFKVFFPNMRHLSGQGSLAGGMSGHITSPDFYGEFKFNNGKVVASNIPLSLSQINLKSSIRGTKASLIGSFDSGGGVADVTGNLDWANGFSLKALLTGNKLLVKQPPMLLAHVSPKISVNFEPEQRLVVLRGNIDVVDAVVTPPPSSENQIKASDDVRLINQPMTVVKAKKASPWKIDTDLSMTFGNDVYFKGFGADAKLALEGKRQGDFDGQLTLKQKTNEGFKADGKITILHNENVRAFGQSMTLRRGAVSFNGGVTKPELDIEAFKIIESHVLGLSIAGTPSKPIIAMFNDAGMSEQETMNALLTGKLNIDNSTSTNLNQTGFKSDINNTLTAAGISLGLSGSRQFTGSIGRSFGLSDLTLDAEAAGTDTQINVTGYITPDLYLRYGRTVFEPVTKLTLRYQINRRLYLEASSAIDKAVDLFYNWRF